MLIHGSGADFLILLIYVLTFSFAGALVCFLLFHAVLISTGQTTVDFWGNLRRRQIARANNKPDPENPFDLGARQNWEQVFGRMHWSLALLPSFREAPWPPYATREDIEFNRVEYCSGKKV
mmetsp:Transcript_16074/g.22455  ORF Transcript_16074/g.22455 Transcript_16074/m.22455 type:complete len:121 (-) Transcript_16074:106-468(-)